MKLTQKLLGYLNRIFEKGPDKTLALRVRHDGAMTWSVADGVLRTFVSGGSGNALTIQLDEFTVTELAAFISAQPGYSVPFVDTSSIPGLSATVLMDGEGNQDASNGDHFYAYTSALWAYLESQSGELSKARAAIDEALLQMAASTSSGEWVDEHGSFYSVPRRSSGEEDSVYAARIVAEVGRARGTRIAIGEAVKRAVSAESVAVSDYGIETTSLDGTKSYGLFDVSAVIDVNAPVTPEQIEASTRAVIESMRDSGTFLRELRYVRTSNLVLRTAAIIMSGHDVTVCFQTSFSAPLTLDGSWLLAGGEVLDGVKNGASPTAQLAARGWVSL